MGFTSYAIPRPAIALAIVALAGTVGRLDAQNTKPADIAAKLNGRWTLNEDLTPVAARPGRGRASFAISGRPAQRGGRGGGGAGAAGGGAQPGDASSPLMAEEVAAQAALMILHEVPKELTIESTAETVVFREPRGEWHFTIDGKKSDMEVPGGVLHTKSRWDRGALHQEFSSARKKLVKSWSIDANDRLVLTERFESFSSTSESKAVFDRQ